jgi:hypothetical protein
VRQRKNRKKKKVAAEVAEEDPAAQMDDHYQELKSLIEHDKCMKTQEEITIKAYKKILNLDESDRS